LLGGRVSHISDSPSPSTLFFSRRVSTISSASSSFELVSLRAPPLYFVAGRIAVSIPRQPLLARLQEVLRPAIVEVLVDPFLAAQLSDAVLAAQTRNHDPDLFLRCVLPAGRPAQYRAPPSPLPPNAAPLSSSSPLLPRLR